MNFHKVCHETIPSFDKMQSLNAQESIHASFKWYEKELTGLFLSATSVVKYVILSVWSTDFLHFFNSSYCISIGYFFPKWKKLLMFLKFVIKSMIMVNYAPFYLITDPNLCERYYLHDFTYMTGF